MAEMDEATRATVKAEQALRMGVCRDGTGGGKLLDTVLAEAREEGRREKRLTIRQMVWREALQEAAQVNARLAKSTERIGGHAVAGALREAEDGILALADQPPPDTAWRDRPPTPEEVEAHEGPWILQEAKSIEGAGCYGVANGAAVRSRFAMSPKLWTRAIRCRPVTRELWPAPWPKLP